MNRIRNLWDDFGVLYIVIALCIGFAGWAVYFDASHPVPPEPKEERVKFMVHRFETETLDGQKVTCFQYERHGISCVPHKETR